MNDLIFSDRKTEMEIVNVAMIHFSGNSSDDDRHTKKQKPV